MEQEQPRVRGNGTEFHKHLRPSHVSKGNLSLWVCGWEAIDSRPRLQPCFQRGELSVPAPHSPADVLRELLVFGTGFTRPLGSWFFGRCLFHTEGLRCTRLCSVWTAHWDLSRERTSQKVEGPAGPRPALRPRAVLPATLHQRGVPIGTHPSRPPVVWTSLGTLSAAELRYLGIQPVLALLCRL